MYKKIAVSETSTMVCILPPEEVIEHFRPHFEDDAFEGAGPHVTLAYLGKTSEKEFEEIQTILTSIKEDLRPVKLGIEGAGCFKGQEANVRLALVNGVGFDMWSLKVRASLKRAGLLPPSDHGFLPHMTLAYEKENLQTGWEKPMLEADQNWICDTLVLSRGYNNLTEFKVG